MQRAGLARRKRLIKYINLAVAIVLVVALVVLDQLTKKHFKALCEQVGTITVIENFFFFKYTFNTGAAWSFLADKSWAQIVFKIITVISLIAFIVLFVFAYKKNYKWLQYSLAITVAGTVGNFIDRLLLNGVMDFISFQFGSYFFPVFNVADICLTVGVIMIIIHFLFIDDNAVFKGNK